MGRNIDLTQPLSDEDRQWLEDRGDYTALRRAAEAAGESDEEPDEADEADEDSQDSEDEDSDDDSDDDDSEDDESDEDDEDAVAYEDLTNAQLAELLEARDLPKSGTKAEMVARLIEDDESAEDEDDQ